MKPSSCNRFVVATALAFTSFTVGASADTVTFPLSPAADARIFDVDWGRDNNDGAGGDIGIYYSRDRSVLRFDFSQLPAGATISSANLNLTVSGTFGGNPNGESMNAYRLTQAWTEGGVTWNRYDGTTAWATAGGDYDGTVRATSTANAGVGQTVTWDVTTLAQEWANNTSPNQGLIIINSGSTNGLHFASKESGNGTYRPYLATTITTPTAPPSGSWTWNGGDGVGGPVDGSGTWTDVGKWWNGAAVATWADGNDAIFGAGGTAGTVTVSGTVAPKSLWFQATGSGNYSLTGGTIDLGGAFRVVQTNVNASIISSLTNGGLIKQGGGTLSLTSTGTSGTPVNTFTAGTVISGGTLEIYGRSADNGGFTSLGTGPVTINTGATLVSASDWTTGNEWNGGNVGTITVNAGGTWTINGAGNTVRSGLLLNGGTVNGSGASPDWGGMYLKNTSVTVGGAATSSISVDTVLNATTGITVGSGSQLNYSGKLHNQIGSTGGITKNGDGTLNLSGNNTYTGTTTTQGGLLEISGGNSSIGPVSSQGGLLSVTGGTHTLGAATTNSGNMTFGGNAVATVASYSANANWNTLTIQDAADVTFTGGITLTNLSTAYRFNGGTVRTPSIRGSQVVWESSNSGVFFNGTEIIATQNNPDFLTMNGWESWSVAWIQPGAGAIINTAGFDIGIQRALCDRDGSGQLTKKGLGKLTLHRVESPPGRFTGGTTVDQGILELIGGAGGNGVLRGALTVNPGAAVTLPPGGDGTGFGSNGGAKLDSLTINSGTVNADSSLLWGITVNMTGGTLDGSFQWNFVSVNTAESPNTATISGAINLRSDNSFTNSTFTVEDGAAATDLLVSSNITESASGLGIIKEGSGRMQLTGTNSYSGETAVNGGTLSLGSAFLADTSAVTIVGGATLDLPHGAQDTVDTLFLDGNQADAGVWGSLSSSAPNKTALITGTGTLNVLSGPPVADAYLAWIDTYYPGATNPLIIGGMADPDNDGIANLVEYVLKDGDPSISSTGILPTLNASGANFVFTFFSRAAATGVTQVFESSTTLGAGSWTSLAIPGGAGVAVTPNTPSPGIDQVVITVPKVGNTKLFGRLQVVK
jgi:autotransporter-associated beta strand protein